MPGYAWIKSALVLLALALVATASASAANAQFLLFAYGSPEHDYD